MEIDNYSSVQRPASFPAGSTNVSRAPAREERQREDKEPETTANAAPAPATEEQFRPSAPRGSILDISV